MKTPDDTPASPAPKTHTCGTLQYTRHTVTLLFAWLLWGDFCFTLMESVVPSIAPLKLQKLGASSSLLSLILTTLPAILNLTVCPWVSFKSDRHRSRWGRRIPFILSTMPFLCISLILIGWSESLATLATTWLPGLSQVAPATVTITLLAIFLVVFQFFNLFVNSVYWYLFNDVVPPHLLGRFTGMFRIVGTGAGALYSGFIFPHGLTHMREITTGAALLYFVGFGLMCIFVKEGEYPPSPDADKPHVGPLREFIDNFQTYAKECFSTRFYWYWYLSQAFFAMACAGGIFGMFVSIEMGLDLTQMGQLGMIGQVIGMVAVYFASIFVDRWHPMRILTYMAVFGTVGGFGGWIWLLITFPSDLYFWMNVAGGFAGVFAGALNGCCFLPAFMRLMPKSRYGQLSSAYSMVRSAATIVAGVLVGLFMDLLLKLHGGDTFAYRYLGFWFWGCNILATICYVLAYRKWLQLGGDAGYRAPAPWDPSGFEAVTDAAPSVPTSPKHLMLGLHLNTAIIVLNLLAVPALLWLVRHDGSFTFNLFRFSFAFQYHAMPAAAALLKTFMIPALLVVLALWLRLVLAIKADLRTVARGAAIRLGIPHHGVLIVLGLQGLVSVLIGWLQFAWLIHIQMEFELMIIALASVLLLLANVLAYQLLRVIESPPPRALRRDTPDTA